MPPPRLAIFASHLGLRTRAGRTGLGCLIVVTVHGAALAQSTRAGAGGVPEPVLVRWRAGREAARHAYAARDYVTYRDDLRRLHDIAPGFPDVVFRLAGAEARLGDKQAALAWLGTFAATGLTRDVLGDSDLMALPSLQRSDTFVRLLGRIARNAAPVSHADTVTLLPDPELLAEDIAYDPTRRTFYVSSVRERKIIAVDAAGQVRDFTRDGQDGVWSILALAVDSSRGVLWATTSATPMARQYTAADSGRSALLEYDLRTERLLRRYDPPDALPNHALGDMTVAPNGDVYVSDGRAGILYTLRHDGDRLEPLVGPDLFASPQTPAVTPDGRRVLVADYLRGIASVDIATGNVQWLAHADSIAVNGIDGLYLVGHTLLAIQNGTMPERVVRYTLDSSLSRITRWQAIESSSAGLGDPTHGVVVGDEFYFIANSGWDRFADDGAIKPNVPATTPVIRRVPSH